MGLDFTTIADSHGAALYVLTSSSVREAQKFERLKAEIARLSDHQVVVLDVRTPDGEKIRDFYDIAPETLPMALIVRDDDSIAQQWSKDYIPAVDVIVHHLRQISQ